VLASGKAERNNDQALAMQPIFVSFVAPYCDGVSGIFERRTTISHVHIARKLSVLLVFTASGNYQSFGRTVF
jgi:hypothetical protein